MSLPKLLPVSFLLRPPPASMAEASYLYTQLGKFAPVAQCSYQPKGLGTLSIRYPNKMKFIYSVNNKEVPAFIEALRSLAGVPRLKFYNEVFLEKGQEKYEYHENFTTVTKDDPLMFKRSSDNVKWDSSKLFSVNTRVLSFQDTLKEGEALVGKEEQKKLDAEIDIKSKGFLKRKFGSPSKTSHGN